MCAERISQGRQLEKWRINWFLAFSLVIRHLSGAISFSGLFGVLHEANATKDVDDDLHGARHEQNRDNDFRAQGGQTNLRKVSNGGHKKARIDDVQQANKDDGRGAA